MRRRLTRRTRVLGVVSVGCLAVLAPAAADASATDGALTRVTAPNAAISLPIPEGWQNISPPPGLVTKSASEMRAFFSANQAGWSALGVDVDKLSDAQLTAFATASLKDIELWLADTRGDGDNITVKVQSGSPFHSLERWRKIATASAKASKGTLVSTAKSRVGNRTAFTSLERDPWPDGGSVYYGYMEIADGRHRVVSISITVDEQSRALVEAMLGGVTPST